MDTYICARCKKEFRLKDENRPLIGNYGVINADEKICFPCCAEVDKEIAIQTGRWVGYLVQEVPNPPRVLTSTLASAKQQFRPYDFFATNWPGSLRIPVYHVTTGRHNMAGTRTDVWFRFPGDAFIWHGVNIGDNQILRCKRTKKKEF